MAISYYQLLGVSGFLRVFPGFPTEVPITCRLAATKLTISFGSVLEAEGEGELGLVLEELGGEGVPPEVVRLLRPLLQPLVHLEYSIVRLQDGHRSPKSKDRLKFCRAIIKLSMAVISTMFFW